MGLMVKPCYHAGSLDSSSRVALKMASILLFSDSYSPREGEKLTLVPIYLRSLYARLEEWYNLPRPVGRCDLIAYAVTWFLQIFLWERFVAIAPKPVEFLAIEMVENLVDRVKRHNHKTTRSPVHEYRWGLNRQTINPL